MPLEILPIRVDGRINRREERDSLQPGEVLERENFLVEGISDEKHCRKMPGSDRYTTVDLGGDFTSGYRYYNGNMAKTYAFNDSTKYLYFIDELGNQTEILHMPSPGSIAIPCYEEMKISDNNMMYASDGFNGMYSYDGNIANTFQKESSVTLNFVDMVSHLDRMFGIEEDSDAVNVSVNLNPVDYTDATDAVVFLVGSKRGSKLMRIIKYQNSLYLFKDDSIWVLEGETPSTFSLREVVPNLGLAARWGLAVTPTAIVFLASDFEVYQFNGTLSSLKLLTYNLVLSGDNTKDINEVINRDRASQVRACYHNYLVRIAFTETGETYNNLEYIFNTANEIDAFTRGNNVSCYIVYDKSVDKRKLVTGRSDGVGLLMTQYRGLNWDNQSTNPIMSLKLTSGFIKPKDIDNIRFKRLYGYFASLGADNLPITYYLDTRLAKSTSKTVNLEMVGEQKNITNFIRINNQTSIITRAILHWGWSQGNSLAISIDTQAKDLDISISGFFVEAISKGRKRSIHVGV